MVERALRATNELSESWIVRCSPMPVAYVTPLYSQAMAPAISVTNRAHAASAWGSALVVRVTGGANPGPLLPGVQKGINTSSPRLERARATSDSILMWPAGSRVGRSDHAA